MSVHRRSPSRGATLVEVLLVLIVVAILIGLSVPRYKSARERAQYASLKADLADLRTAQEAYYAEHRRYATDIEDLHYTSKNGAVIALSSNDPATSWRAVAIHPTLSGSCFVSAGMEGEPGASSGVECDSYSYTNSSIEK
jgi:general secretion pathway protein G